MGQAGWTALTKSHHMMTEVTSLSSTDHHVQAVLQSLNSVVEFRHILTNLSPSSEYQVRGQYFSILIINSPHFISRFGFSAATNLVSLTSPGLLWPELKILDVRVQFKKVHFVLFHSLYYSHKSAGPDNFQTPPACTICLSYLRLQTHDIYNLISYQFRCKSYASINFCLFSDVDRFIADKTPGKLQV